MQDLTAKWKGKGRMVDAPNDARRPLPGRPLPPTPAGSPGDLSVHPTRAQPTSIQLSRNLSFATNDDLARAMPRSSDSPTGRPMHQRTGSLANSLASRSSSEAPRTILEADEDIVAPPPSLMTIDGSLEREGSMMTMESAYEVQTAKRVDLTPVKVETASPTIKQAKSRENSVPGSPATPGFTTRSPRVMASTGTFAHRSKLPDSAVASPLPADAASRVREHSSEGATLKAPAASTSRAATQPARRPKDVRVPEFPHADVPRAPTGGLYWSRAPVHGRLPYHPLRAHTATLIGSAIWVFGGCDIRACFRDVWKLDLDSWCWSKPKVGGEMPPLCRAHSATLYKDRLYIFGGGEGPHYYNTMYCLNTTTLMWSKPTVYGQVPSARRAHAALLYKDRIIIFGGGNGNRALNDVFACNVKDPAALEWVQVETKGKAPISRGYHTMNRVGSKAVVFGGSDGAECFGDISVLDLETFAWMTVELDDMSQSFPRLSHTTVQVGSLLYIFGGHDGIDYSNAVLVFNLVTLQFEKRETWGAPPSPRGYSTAIYHDSRIVLIGGFDGKTIFSDTMSLELGTDSYHALITRWSGLLGQ